MVKLVPVSDNSQFYSVSWDKFNKVKHFDYCKNIIKNVILYLTVVILSSKILSVYLNSFSSESKLIINQQK